MELRRQIKVKLGDQDPVQGDGFSSVINHCRVEGLNVAVGLLGVLPQAVHAWDCGFQRNCRVASLLKNKLDSAPRRADRVDKDFNFMSPLLPHAQRHFGWELLRVCNPLGRTPVDPHLERI